ncbi:MAG: Xaa-Pro peptidase family protein [Oscillospiraceae bacterium]|nr:Xaa-Pro peptidase family protein [Oscillospiraceae bacterium]
MSRFQKIAERLAASNLDAMLIVSPSNRFYAAGFASSAGTAVVTSGGSYFFVDSRYIEAAKRTIQDAEIRMPPAAKADSVLEMTREVLEKHHVKRLGFEENFVTVKRYGQWKNAFPFCELVPAAQLLTGLRAVKEETELESMVKAQRIAEKALTEVLNFIRPGRTEKEISAYLQYQMLLHGAEKMSFEPIVVGGPNSSMPHGVPTERPVSDGDFLTMDFGCVYEGYCSDMTRTVAVGHVTEEMERVYQTVLQAQLAGIAAARGGVTGKSVHEAGAKVIADAGYGAYFGHGFGHGLGIDVHEEPRFSPLNEKPVPAGAVLSAEPGIYLPGRFGVRIEDAVIVGETESRSIMEAPKELLILQ